MTSQQPSPGNMPPTPSGFLFAPGPRSIPDAARFTFGITILHLAETAFLTLPALALVIASVVWLVQTYGPLMSRLARRLSRACINIVQLLVLMGALLLRMTNARLSFAEIMVLEKDGFLHIMSDSIHYAAACAGFIVFGIARIYSIEVITSRKLPQSLAELLALLPFAGIRSLRASSTKAHKQASAMPNASDSGDIHNKENGDRDHDTQPSNENEPDTEDESAVSEDSELSLFGHTELAGWQTESKAD